MKRIAANAMKDCVFILLKEVVDDGGDSRQIFKSQICGCGVNQTRAPSLPMTAITLVGLMKQP